METIAPPPTCHGCGRKAGLEHNNVTGGRYYACNGCGFTWNGRDGRLNTKRRGTSQRADTIIHVMQTLHCTRDEATEYVDVLGLKYVKDSVA